MSWPTEYEPFKERLRATQIPADKEEAFRKALAKHFAAIPGEFSKEEQKTLWDILTHCIISPSAPEPAKPLSLSEIMIEEEELTTI